MTYVNNLLNKTVTEKYWLFSKKNFINTGVAGK